MEFLGWVVFYYFTFKVVQSIVHSISEDKEQRYEIVKKYLDRIIHRVEIVVVNGITYWFDKDNNAFLGQGKTVEDIIEVLDFDVDRALGLPNLSDQFTSNHFGDLFLSTHLFHIGHLEK